MNTLFKFGFKKKAEKPSSPKVKSVATESEKQPSPKIQPSIESCGKKRSKPCGDEEQLKVPGHSEVSVSGHLTKKARLENPNDSRKGTATPMTTGRPKRKRKLIRPNIIDSDSENDDDDGGDDDYVAETSKDLSVAQEESDSDSDEDIPLSKLCKKSLPARTPKPSMSAKAKSAKKTFTYSTPPMMASSSRLSTARKSTAMSAKSASGKVGVLDAGEHMHNHLKWLSKEHVKDKHLRKPDHADYDPTTLYFPSNWLATGNNGKKITPGMAMFWKLKQDFFDTVLFYKVGKFYELYHMDADIGVEYLNMLYMKGDWGHAGFPEISYGKFSSILCDLGFRVARVEQVETPAQMRKRTGKSSGCVARKVCSVLSPGTRTLSFRDGKPDGLEKVLLLSISESKCPTSGKLIFGVSACDPTTGIFRIGQFFDEENRAQLRTILARENPAEIVYEIGNISIHTMEVLNHMCPVLIGRKGTCLHTGVQRIKDFSRKKLKEKLTDKRSDYFSSDEALPDVFKPLNSDEEFELKLLTFKAFNLTLKVLERALIAHELITMKQFFVLDVPGYVDKSATCNKDPNEIYHVNKSARMVMDGQALLNLQVVQSESGDPKDTLFAYLDHCSTSFGKRQLKEWVCSPLFCPEAIVKRQNIVKAFVEHMLSDGNGKDVISTVRNSFNKVCDIERLLSRIHALGLQKLKSHPDSDAVLYENEKYNKSKIQMLVDVLTGIRQVVTGLQSLSNYIQEEIESKFSCMKDILDATVLEEVVNKVTFFEKMFDLREAKRLGVIKPKPGVLIEYDEAKHNVKMLKQALEDELLTEKAKLGTPGARKIKFFHPANGKDIYQMEVPDAALPKNKNAPSHWMMKTHKKGFRRYHTPKIEALTKDLIVSETGLESREADATRAVYEKFDSYRETWTSCMESVRDIDCFISLALVSDDSSDEAPMCVPEIVAPQGESPPVFTAEEARHPVVAAMLEKSGQDFIPNDFSLGEDGKTCLLLTGPNMGGKSTLLRQTCVIAIMAQIGCYVPAKSCRLTPIDRIFTRIGASDRIMSGQSTFYVELDETSTILHGATKNSLVILDELGRGTSTFDGTAIAYAVVEKLCNTTLRCRTLFATHYHALIQEFSSSDIIKLGHMACFADTDEHVNTVTFLYKLQSGPSDKSHGLNVARLAKISEAVLKRAYVKSEEFEIEFELKRLMNAETIDQAKVKELWQRAKELMEKY